MRARLLVPLATLLAAFAALGDTTQAMGFRPLPKGCAARRVASSRTSVRLRTSANDALPGRWDSREKGWISSVNNWSGSPMLAPIVHVQNIVWTEPLDGTDEKITSLKAAVMKYGAVAVSMFYKSFYEKGTTDGSTPTLSYHLFVVACSPAGRRIGSCTFRRAACRQGGIT